jgi:hypothetical protein
MPDHLQQAVASMMKILPSAANLQREFSPRLKRRLGGRLAYRCPLRYPSGTLHNEYGNSMIVIIAWNGRFAFEEIASSLSSSQ